MQDYVDFGGEEDSSDTDTNSDDSDWRPEKYESSNHTIKLMVGYSWHNSAQFILNNNYDENRLNITGRDF